MKYSCYSRNEKQDDRGGAYWTNFDFDDHIKLNDLQTSYNYILDKFDQPIKVLEAGCGLGRWAIGLAENGHTVKGIEIENDAVHIVNEKYSLNDLEIIQGSIFNMPFNSQQFDLILSLGVLEHFNTKKMQNNAIAEHLRVLKDNGFFFITVPYINLLRILFHLPYVRIMSLYRKYKGVKENFSEYRYSIKEFKKVITENELEVVEIVWDDLENPFCFGFEYPLSKFFRKKGGKPYELNKYGVLLKKTLWKLHPTLVSSGVGFLCRKNKL